MAHHVSESCQKYVANFAHLKRWAGCVAMSLNISNSPLSPLSVCYIPSCVMINKCRWDKPVMGGYILDMAAQTGFAAADWSTSFTTWSVCSQSHSRWAAQTVWARVADFLHRKFLASSTSVTLPKSDIFNVKVHLTHPPPELLIHLE